ncbi:hypothetical protein MIND_00787900 [Mycena indigotica]|uniref:DUF6589 domain-containing protein n=1 Tax=Mycena indigotica TaxID=2126181 RepID=A0A8H6SLZ3_9AGAR|nr:uncharacterized protein MIND_00787900 [Mycena indigotica]KAF7302210.1 hypothetical protein MIND_00787900 [Mycena indigotica]
MEDLTVQLEQVAPTLWETLGLVSTPDQSTRRQSSGDNRRDKSLVFTTICALVSVLRSQKANNFQMVVGLFLLGSGASKREISVLAHAGLSISYALIIDHVKKLSTEGLVTIQEVFRTLMVQIVWDNLNIAFRIAEQRMGSKNHFDSGTTATMIPVFDPATGKHAAHGTLPLETNLSRERTLPVLDWTADDILPSPQEAEQISQTCLWQLKRIALEHIPGVTDVLRESLGECPTVHQIPLHKTEQYPLPAMKLDESSLDGTIEVYETILRNIGVNDEALRKHGIVFDDGDLLTDSLKEKFESARRNSTTPIAGFRASCRRFGLFHAEMAGCRLTINEHWGSPNSVWPGSLWWEHNKLLHRKPVKAGWGNKKATDWKPAHELLQISIAGHIMDGFRLYCPDNELEKWASKATVAQFNEVADSVMQKLFSTKAIVKLHSQDKYDTVLENNILYNRDTLFYIDFVHALKQGDISRVVNILRIWTLMMRSPKTMPRYADAMFETLVRIKHFPDKQRELYLANWLVNLSGRPFGFKPVDLLQEHQNMWAKTVYNAKSANKNWNWLAMITVCIYSLREAMRTVQTSFRIPAYGEKHKSPEIKAEVAIITAALKDNNI